MQSIGKLIFLAKNGDKASMEEVIIKFEPILSSLSRKSKSECAKTDLVIFLIKMIKDINFTNMTNTSDGAIVNYIKKSLYREYYRINKGTTLIENRLIDQDTIAVSNYSDIEYKIFLDELVIKKVISEKQKYVLLRKYGDSLTETEISKELCVSRQAVNKLSNLAIKNIRKHLN